MKLIMLMVLFSPPAEPSPHMEHGFGPRVAASVEQCLNWRDNAQEYLAGAVKDGVRFKVFCVEFDAHGYDEAVDAFRRQLGDPA